jgi:hypothetical protein
MGCVRACEQQTKEHREALAQSAVKGISSVRAAWASPPSVCHTTSGIQLLLLLLLLLYTG